MPRRSYDDLLRGTSRKELAPVYYFFGTEEVLKDAAIRALIDLALEPHERDFNLDQRSAAGLGPEDLHALVNTLPMMAARRVVVFRDIEAWRKKSAAREALDRYLANPSPDTVVILVESGPANEEKKAKFEPDEQLIAHAVATDFKPLEGDRVVRWITHQAKERGITFADGAAEHLAAATLYELGTIQSELEKIATLAGGVPITREQVGDLVGIRHGETVEDWLEAVLGGDTARALSLVKRVLEQSGMSGVKMVTSMGTALIGLRLARAHYDQGSRGSSLERILFERLRQVRPFGLGDWRTATQNWSRWAESWTAPRLRAATRAALEADMALKGTRVSDERGVITDLVLRLAPMANPTMRRPIRRGHPTAAAR
jgi:DNA polymerase-3 subunit delta